MSVVMQRWGVGALVLVLGVPLAGCGSTASTQPAAGKRVAVVSLAPQAWLVRQIGGPHVEVLTLVSPADNHHTYQPTDAQISRLMQADVFFRIGMPFEKGPWFQAIQSSGRLSIVDGRQGIELRRMESHLHCEGDEHSPEGDSHASESAEAHEQAHDHEGEDPHIWLSPRLLKFQAGTVAQALEKVDPVHHADYQQNLRVVQERLDQLDAQIRQKLAPLAGKSFFLFHPAWGYFADEYGLKQVAIEIEGKQPTDAELTQLQEEAKRQGIKAIFVQPQITGQAAGAVAAAVGARLETLDPLLEDVPTCLLKAADAIAQSYQEKAK